MINFNYKSGFTLVETMVAITILMIAIAGPLVVASKGLSGAKIAKDQMAASYLAQESMEVVKNIRDNNLYLGSDWLTGLSTCTLLSTCDASAVDNWATPMVCGASPCQIYVEKDGYGHVVAANKVSPFKRNFYIHSAQGTGNCTSSDECGVTVEVTWHDGPIPFNVIMTSEITSTIR